MNLEDWKILHMYIFTEMIYEKEKLMMNQANFNDIRFVVRK
jgi:hypothetical protein